MTDPKIVSVKRLSYKQNYSHGNNTETNTLKKHELKIIDVDEEIKDNNTKDNLPGYNNKPEGKEDKKSPYLENNIKLRDMIENALFSQLSEIKVKFMYAGDDPYALPIFKNPNIKNHLPKIHNIELTLLNQDEPISEFKKYGYGIYMFFHYIKIILITFLILLIFAAIYIYNIFFNFYRKYEEEYSLIYDSNLLLIITGTQIIRFREFYIEIYGKEAFLKKFKNFDVFYKEYLISFFIIFGTAILYNIIMIIISYRDYRKFKSPGNTLILSGSDEPDEIIEKDPDINKIESSEENNNNSNNNKKIKITKTKIYSEEEIKEKIGIKENIEIQFTKKCSQYYECLEELDELYEKISLLEYKNSKKSKNECIPHAICDLNSCIFGCFCSFCYCCKCWCCKCRIENKKKEIIDTLNKIDEFEKNQSINEQKEQINPVYLITFKNKDDMEDYNKVYKKFPSFYLWYKIKTCCKKQNTFFINKAPSPEDIAWKNLEYSKGHNYISSKAKILGFSLLHVFGSFVIQLFGEVADYYLEDAVDFFVINIIVSYYLEKLDDFYGEMISTNLNAYFKYWSFSDITFYNILYQTIFKFISKGIFPILTYFLTNFAYHKWFHKEYETDYTSLVSKLFIIIEMDGFGFPFIDWLVNIVPKLKGFKENSEKIFSHENIEKEINKIENNQDGLSAYELKLAIEKQDMDLEGKYSDVLSSYWITMLYFPIYPIGVIQTIFNLLFKFITEKNLLINVYKRPNYTNPSFGFFCINYFNFGFFLYLLGNFIFYRNEDNKDSFGLIYFVIMVLVFILPVFFGIARLIFELTNFCCEAKKDKNDKSLEDLVPEMEYSLFNPLVQKEKIKELFNDKNVINESQEKELIAQLDKMEKRDLYFLYEKFRIPRNIQFEESLSVPFDKKDKKKIKIYYLLIQLGFLPYYEIGMDLNIKPLPGKQINSQSLRRLSLRENITNTESGIFCLDKSNNIKLTIAYIEKETKVVIYDVYNREPRDLKYLENNKNIIYNINCFNFNNKQYLAIIDSSNNMSIYDISEENEKLERTVKKIGDNFEINDKIKLFGLSSVKHDNSIWIITSYYEDSQFKIFDFNILMDKSQNNDNNNVYNNNNQIVINQIISNEDKYKLINNNEKYIVSLESSFYSQKIAFIWIRTPEKIKLFINDYSLPVKIIKLEDNYDYINFKLLPMRYNNISLIISSIKTDLSEYNIKILNLFEFLNPNLSNFINLSEEQKNNNEQIKSVLLPLQNNLYEISPYVKKKFTINLDSIDKKLKEAIKLDSIDKKLREKRRKQLKEKYNKEKYYIGNILFWDESYLIFGTPFDFLLIIDYSKNELVAVIHNTKKEKEKGEEKGQNNDDEIGIVTYNISERIEDPHHGSCFIIRDNKGKIQFIEASKDNERLNFSIKHKKRHFDDYSDDIKINRIRYSAKFFLYYYLLYLLFPLITYGIAKGEIKQRGEKAEDYLASTIAIICLYLVLGILLKGCYNNVYLRKSICLIWLYIFQFIFIITGFGFLFYILCWVNETVLYFLLLLNILFLAHIIFFYSLYCCKKKYLLRIYLLEFMFYQISRLCIIICFAIMININLDNFEIYIYILILTFFSGYMFFANYLITLQKEIIYKNKFQALCNYNFEWMNIFCFCCNIKGKEYENEDKCYANPRECIKNNDEKYCTSFDNCLVEKFPRFCEVKSEEDAKKFYESACTTKCCSCCSCCSCCECDDKCWECADYYS